MKNTTSALLLGLGLVAAVPFAGAAFAQSAPPAQSERQQMPDRYQDDDRGYADERDSRGYSDERGSGRYDERDYADNRGARDDDERYYRRSRGRDGYRRGHRRLSRFLRRYDTNGDGNVTRIEFAEGVKKRFEQLDANNDGVISSKELADYSNRRHAQWRQRN